MADQEQQNNNPEAIQTGSAEGQATPLDDTKPIPAYKRTPRSLLPVRYALADTKSKTPNLSAKVGPKGNFAVEDLDGKAFPKIPGKDGCHYTLRRLRKDSYLQVFCEENSVWYVFKTGEAGVLSAVLQHPDASSGSNDTKLVQADSNRLAVLTDQPIWLGFTDARMTLKIMDEREKDLKGAVSHAHFRKFEPKAWEGKKHTAPDAEGCLWIADAKSSVMPENPQKNQRGAFWFSNEPLHKVKVKDRDGAIVALEDPTGMAMDILGLIRGRFEVWHAAPDTFLKDRSRIWAKTADACIEQIRSQIEKRSEAQWIWKKTSPYSTERAGAGWVNSAEQAKYLGSLQKQEIEWIQGSGHQSYADSVWKNYQRSLAQNESLKNSYTQWKTHFAADTKTFNDEVMKPLDELLRIWISSKRFLAYFRDVFDPSDRESGRAYTRMVGRCIEGAQELGTTNEKITEFLEKELTAEDNPIGRALLMNHEDTIQKINKHHDKGLAGFLEVTWKDTIQGFQDFLTASKEGHTPLLGAQGALKTLQAFPEIPWYASLLAGPLTGIATQCLVSNKTYASMVALGVIGDSPVIPISRALSTTQIREEGVATLATWMRRQDPHISLDQVKTFTELQLRSIKAAGLMEDGTKVVTTKLDISRWGFEWLEDSAMVGALKDDLLKGTNPEVSRKFKTFLEKERLEGIKTAAKDATGIALMGVLGLVSEISNFNYNYEKLQESGFKEKKRMLGMAGNAFTMGSLIGTSVENAVGKFSKAGARFGTAVNRTPSLFKFGGRVCAVVAGVISVVMDGMSLLEEKRKKHYGMVGLYFLSMAAGFTGAFLAAVATACLWSSTIATFVASTLSLQVTTGAGVAAALGVAGAYITLVGLVIFAAIYLAQNDPYQDWMECCTFGIQANTDKDMRYKTMDEELSMFKKALGLEPLNGRELTEIERQHQALGDAMKKAAESNPNARYAFSQRTR